MAGRAGVGLDHVKDAPRGVIFDGENLLTLLVVVPVHVDGDAGVLPYEPDPRPFAALFVWIFGHVFVLLKDRMDAVGGDREIISNTEDVSNGLCTSSEALAQFEDACSRSAGYSV